MTRKRERPAGARPPDTPWDWTRSAAQIAYVLRRILDGKSHELRTRGWRTIAAAHGYPSCDAMRANLTALEPLGAVWVTFDVPAPSLSCEACHATFRTPAALALHRNRSTVHAAERSAS